MKSKFVQKFNHDPIANGYNDNVQNEDNPIRKVNEVDKRKNERIKYFD